MNSHASADGLLKHPSAYGMNQTVLFQHRYKNCRRYILSLKRPSEQNLSAKDGAIPCRNHGLNGYPEILHILHDILAQRQRHAGHFLCGLKMFC